MCKIIKFPAPIDRKYKKTAFSPQKHFDYRAISLAGSIKKYFEINPNAMEVLVFKGNKSILLKRTSVESRDFFKTFVKRYNK